MYEWDETKRAINLEKHGLDFADAHLVYENEEKLTLQSPRGVEDMALVEMAGEVLSPAYVLRGKAVRVISFRRASRRERRLYAEVKGNG
jgi:uncharacterized DUF497 family protein